MRTDELNGAGRGDGPVHGRSAALKASLALGAILIVVLSPARRPLMFAAVGVLLLGVIIFARLPWRPILKKMALIEPMLIAVAALALIQPGGGARFAVLLARSTLSLTILVVLIATTAFPELLALLRRLHGPPILTTMAALLYRYVFVLGEEMQRMRRARRSRTFRKSRAGTWRSLSTSAGALFLRTTERSERIYRAMIAR
ncbi:MAG: cobalt ECF transporter T component CbiQ, partial [Candidatus Aminicenantales bacterium]